MMHFGRRNPKWPTMLPKQKVTVLNTFTKDSFGIFRVSGGVPTCWPSWPRCHQQAAPPSGCSPRISPVSPFRLSSHITPLQLVPPSGPQASTTLGSSGKYHSRVFGLVRLKRVCLLDVGAELELILAIPHVRAPPWLLPLVVRIHKLQSFESQILAMGSCVRAWAAGAHLPWMGGVDHVGAVKASSKMPGSSIPA
jgi:hypothetical protein